MRLKGTLLALVVLAALSTGACATPTIVRCTGTADQPHKGTSAGSAGQAVAKMTVRCDQPVDWIRTEVSLQRFSGGWTTVGGQVQGDFKANTSYLQGVAAGPCVTGRHRTMARYNTQYLGDSAGWTDWKYNESDVRC